MVMNPRLRELARRLPITSAYERRIAELHGELRQLRADTVVAGGEFVPPGHFYSAIPDRAELKTRFAAVFERDPLDIAGVDLRIDAQWALLEQLQPFLADVPFGEKPVGDLRYGYENGAYSYADGLFLHLMLRLLQPNRVIEVGSGHSSACTLDTVGRFLNGKTRCTFVEPYDELLRSLLHPGDIDRVEILTVPVQGVAVSRFAELEAGDVLFIDSTHVSKAGSDVNYLFFDVLPALASGVVVHVHDVFPSFEYPWDWVSEGRVWTEDYLLRAFLQYNSEFEVVLWPSLLAAAFPDRFFGAFPLAQRTTGGAIYLRRR